MSSSRDRRTRPMSRPAMLAALVVAMVAAIAVVAPACAMALTVTGPTGVVQASDYTVTLGSGDPTGTVTLTRDGRNVGTATIGEPGGHATFLVGFKGYGDHTVVATLDSAPPITSDRLRVRVYIRPKPPILTAWTRGALTGRKLRLDVRVGSQVYFVAVYVNGKFVRKAAVTPNRVNHLGIVAMTGSRNTLTLRAGNGGGSATTELRLRRFDYPSKWKTCIVIDKSELRLYWIVNDQLVKWYKCACGRPSLPTPNAIWRVGVKEHMDPSGAFGPRRMRLFRYNGSGYSWTGYGIHGTNSPPSIGTYASHGCIRMYPRDVIELYPQVPMYTMVKTQE